MVEVVRAALQHEGLLASLAILQPDARAAARMMTALGGAHEVLVRSTWRALTEVLVAEAVDGCVVDADHPSRDEARTEIEAIRKQYPFLAIIAYADVAGELEYYDLGELGVDDVLLAGQLEADQIRNLVDQALAANSATRLAYELDGRFGAVGSRAVAWAIEHARSEPSVERFAAAMGRTQGSLVSALRRGGLPSPKTLLLWGRLLRAGTYLGRDRCTVEETAFLLGYSTASSLARAIKKNTGLTASEVAEQGGLACVQAVLFARPRRTAPKERILKVLALALAICSQVGCASAAGVGVGGVDREAIDGILDAAPFDQMHFGVLAIDAQTGRTLFSRDGHRKFIPASNQKILVTATALSLLGPDYRYRTEVWRTGSPLGAFLEGDLVVLASGDPSLSDRYWDSGEAALSAIADTLRKGGLEHVAGSVFVDVSAWDSTSIGPTWEVADLPGRSAATGGAFAINEGEIELIVGAGSAVGLPASVVWSPLGSDDFVNSRLETSPPGSATRVRPSYLPESRQLVLEGRVEFGTVGTFLTEQVGLDSLDIAPRDGSGLSAYNLVTPRALVRILQYMERGANAVTYRDALAEPGEEESTLERRLIDLEGRLFAKTGTISNVNSLSGYLVRVDGTEVIFSILSNGSGLPASRVRAAIDDVVRILAR